MATKLYLEEWVLSCLLLLVGAVRVVPAVVRGELWGAEVTIAAAAMALGFLGLGIQLGGLRRPRLPRARTKD